MNAKARKSWPARVFDFLSGLGLATALLVILMVQTWLATLEQVHYGLHATLQKYFDYSAWYVFPEAGIIHDSLLGKKLPPLPGGYWVCALLVLNLSLGGILRIRKGWRTFGVLLSHFGIIFMVVAGGVAQLREERGVMMLSEEVNGPLPRTADYANSFTETTVEFTEIKDGKPQGPVHFVKDTYYRDLGPNDRRMVRLPALPFDLELQGYVQNAKAMSTSAMAPGRGEPIVDGWFLFSRNPDNQTELDTPGIHARVLPRDGSEPSVHLLVTTDPDAFKTRDPVTLRFGDRTFVMRLDKRVWPVPFQVTLVDARSEYYPNTSRPKLFESDILRTENGVETKHFIEMNAPMREGGLTFYQRTMMNGPTGGSREATISGFEVVRNPADKWPEYSIYVTGIGLCVHFLIKLFGFITRGSKPKAQPQP